MDDPVADLERPGEGPGLADLLVRIGLRGGDDGQDLVPQDVRGRP